MKGSVFMAEFRFKIVKHFGVLGVGNSGWSKELNYVSYNDAPAKYDIRDWAPDHTKMGKGVTLNEEEFESLSALISGYASTKYAQETMQNNARRMSSRQAPASEAAPVREDVTRTPVERREQDNSSTLQEIAEVAAEEELDETVCETA